MANEKSTVDSAAKAMGDAPSKARRAVKAGIILAAAGLTALAISRRMKSRAGKPGKKKARTTAKAAARKTVRKVKTKARAAMKRATAGTRRKSRAR
jgi:hypothetical protein